MVIHAFPAAKLAALLIKQISKPIANAVKQGAKSSPVFRRYVCLPPAQFYNWCEVKAKMWLLQMGQPVNIKVLNEADSIELGANLLGETVIFTIASVILLLEYNRSSRKEAAKEQARKSELQDLKNALRDLFIQTEEQGAHIRELTRKMGDLETKIMLKPKETSGSKPPPQGSSAHIPQPLNFVYDDGHNMECADLLEDCKYKPLRGVIFNALSDMENNIFFDPHAQREPGIITTALNHLYRDVYKSQMTF